MRIQIAVATYHRPTDITRCLATTLPQVRAVSDDPTKDVDVSVLVIDNDPGGSAEAAVTSFADESVTYVVESTPGISAARNRGLSESDGHDAVIYIDDDEEPLEGWLAHLLQTYEDSGATAVAGKVVSDLDVSRSVDHRRRLLRPQATTHRSRSSRRRPPTNLLLDLRFVARHGLRFDDRYGLSGGGSTHFTRRLVAAGGTIVWCEEAVVVDHVPPSRMTRDWVRRRARRMGISLDVGVVDVDIAQNGTERLVRRVAGSSAAASGSARAVCCSAQV